MTTDSPKDQRASDHTNVECLKCGCWRWGYIGETCRTEGCDGLMCAKPYAQTSKERLTDRELYLLTECTFSGCDHVGCKAAREIVRLRGAPETSERCSAVWHGETKAGQCSLPAGHSGDHQNGPYSWTGVVPPRCPKCRTEKFPVGGVGYVDACNCSVPSVKAGERTDG